MKRYYSKTIPVELAIKLQDAGMKIEWEDNTVGEWHECPDVHCLTTYAEVFDWLGEMGFEMEIRRGYINFSEWLSIIIRTINDNSSEHVQSRRNGEYLFAHDWFEAANAGIETALKMLKEGKQ